MTALFKRHLSTDNENRDPTPISWKKMTVPEFPGSEQLKKPLETSQLPFVPPTTYAPQQHKFQQQEPGIYSTVISPREEQSSLRREPEPSPPPPIPSSQPPQIISQQSERTFVDELKQRNLRQQRYSLDLFLHINLEHSSQITLIAIRKNRR
jgi:hypothetical protein